MADTKEDTKIETVKMQDERVVEFAGKRKLLKESFATGDKSVGVGTLSVRLDFRNGETRTFTLPDSMVAKFAVHGAEQKLGDEIAGLADVDDAVIAVDELIDRLYAGEWGVKREGNGLAGTSVLARALAEFKGLPMETIKAFLAKKTPAEKSALRTNEKLKPIIAKIEAEKAAKGPKVDTDAILEEIGA